jgi:cytochrome c-type biogenesis protein CcmH
MIRTGLRAGAVALLVAFMTGALAPAGAATAAVTPRASLTDIESDVMCTACREPLEVAQSPQADSERAYIRGLIAQGEDKSQILKNLVAQYGPAVLGKPPAHGFNLTVYIIPVAILAVGAAILAFTLPREPAPAGPPLDPADELRLEQELSEFRG